MLLQQGWLPAVRARIEALLASPARDDERRVAVLDWDNTMMRGDVGDLALAWMLEHGAVLCPARWDEGYGLSDAGVHALTGATHGLAPGAPIPASRGAELAHIAVHGTTTRGDLAFARGLTRTSRASYAFSARLLAGHDGASTARIAKEAIRAGLARSIGDEGGACAVPFEIFARPHEPMCELLSCLVAAGFETWIVSASAEPLVRTAAALLAGVSPERVIATRLEPGVDGRLTTRLARCDDSGEEVMPFFEGKRRWMQHTIFGVPRSRAHLRPVDRAHRPRFAAGDADTDLAMLEDATELRLVLDRGQIRVCCAALADPSRWALQPLFVAPPTSRELVLPCSSHQDELGPVLDEHGARIADQSRA